MTVRTRRRRLLNLALVAVLGVAVGVVAYGAYLRLTVPGPRAAPGWLLLAEMPDPRGETAVAVDGGSVYVIGGFTGLQFETTRAVSIYDAGQDRWRDGPPLPEGRNHAAALAHDGTVYVSGGATSLTGATSTFWTLVPGAGTWAALPALPGERSGHRMAAVDGRLFVVGGIGGADAGAGAAGHVLVYDLATGAWTEGAPMPLNRDHLAVAVVAGEIWAI